MSPFLPSEFAGLSVPEYIVGILPIVVFIVIFAEPSKFAFPVTAPDKPILLAVFNFVVVSELPTRLPFIVLPINYLFI